MPLTGRQIKELAAQGAARALVDAAGDVLREAEALAPPTPPGYDPHPDITLKLEGHIEIENDGRSVRVIFDGPYAAKQHEAQHFDHPHGGKAKFLETPLKAIIPWLPRIVASEVRARIQAR
jgi:hypothetical protein